jgi:hypothetical protein
MHNWQPQICWQEEVLMIIILANHRLAIAFWYFCSHWDAPLSVGLEQKSKQINQPIAILFEFPTWAVQIPDFFKDTAGE